MKNYQHLLSQTLYPFDEDVYLRQAGTLKAFLKADTKSVFCESIFRRDIQDAMRNSFLEAVTRDAVVKKFFTIMAPTGTGKTFTISKAIGEVWKLDRDVISIPIIIAPDTTALEASIAECEDKGIKVVKSNSLKSARDIDMCFKYFKREPFVIVGTDASFVKKVDFYREVSEKYAFIVIRDEAHHGAHSLFDSKDATGSNAQNRVWVNTLRDFRDMNKHNRVILFTGTPSNALMSTGMAEDRDEFEVIFMCASPIEAAISAELDISRDSNEAMKKAKKRNKECKKLLKELYEKTKDAMFETGVVGSTMVYSAIRRSKQGHNFNSKDCVDWLKENKVSFIQRDQNNNDPNSIEWKNFVSGNEIEFGVFIRLGLTAMSLSNPISVVIHEDSQTEPKDKTKRLISNQLEQRYGRLTRCAFFEDWKHACEMLNKWSHDAEVTALLMRLIKEFAFHKMIYVVGDSKGKALNAFDNKFKMGKIRDMDAFVALVREIYNHRLVKTDNRSAEMVTEVKRLLNRCPFKRMSRIEVAHIIPNAVISAGLIQYEEHVGNYIPLSADVHKLFDAKLFYMEYDKAGMLRTHYAPNLTDIDKEDLAISEIVDGMVVELPYSLSPDSLEYRKAMVMGNV